MKRISKIVCAASFQAALLLLCSSRVVRAQTDWSNSSVLGSFTCSAEDCQLNSGPVTSDYVYSSFFGTCYPSPQAQATYGVGASFPLNLGINVQVGVGPSGACSTPVVVDEVFDFNTVFTPYSGSCNVYAGYITDYVIPGESISVGGVSKWVKTVTFGCNGYVSAVTQAGSIPC